MDSGTDLPVNERNQHMERLLEISRSLSASLDLDPFLHALISAAAKLTGCEVASILELDEGEEQLHFLALPWFHRDALKTVKVPLQTSMAGWVLQNGQPAVVPDAAAEPRHFKGADQVADFATRSLMAVPIIYHEETLGELKAVNKTEHAHYTEEDLTILETLASQAAIAIQTARLMNKVQHSQDQMTQLDRMKSGFIAIASHELRTPLGLILGHATFLREVIQPEHRPQLDIIIHNGLRLKEIIDNLASMDNLQRGVASVRAQPISIKSIVEEVMDSYQQEAEQKRLTMRSDTGQEGLLVECDSSKIAIALSNIIKNAITFTDPGGHIFILAESIPGYVKVSVIDDDIGIPPKDLLHIFERFYQVESYLTRKHEGMGLCLSISKVMVEMHGRRIWAESVEGRGSNFTFLLPINSGQADPASQVFIS
ncbi:MAG TPA: ATP-binding protein [Anaerolineales bacterium]